MSSNGDANRGRGVAQGQRTSLAGAVCCNRCNRPVVTTVFVCGCLCTFCEECTVEHFQVNPNCPVCGRPLTEKDFMDLAVTDPPLVPDNLKNLFQKMFTKKNSSFRHLMYSDICAQFLRQYNDLGSVAKFLLKQMVESSSKQGEDKGGLERAYESLQQETIQLKQAQSAATLEHQAIVNDLQNQLQARTGTVTELQQQLVEKENVINKFRRLHGGPFSPHATMIPVSSHSHRSSSVASGSHHVQPQQQPPQQELAPLHGFMANRAAEERNRQHVLQSQLHRGIVLGGRGTSSSGHHQANLPTPIQVPRRPFTNNKSPGASLRISLPTPRIRDFSSSSGYTFTSRPNHHHPYAQPSRRTPTAASVRNGGSNHVSASARNGSSHLSPTMAFARNQGSSHFGNSTANNNNSFGYGH